MTPDRCPHCGGNTFTQVWKLVELKRMRPSDDPNPEERDFFPEETWDILDAEPDSPVICTGCGEAIEFAADLVETWPVPDNKPAWEWALNELNRRNNNP